MLGSCPHGAFADASGCGDAVTPSSEAAGVFQRWGGPANPLKAIALGRPPYIDPGSRRHDSRPGSVLVEYSLRGGGGSRFRPPKM